MAIDLQQTQGQQFGPAGTNHAPGLVPDPGAAGHSPPWLLGDDGEFHAINGALSVTDFNADPTGSADSTSAIQNTINALPSNGGVVYFPPGNYKISSTLTIGNGSSSAWSTRNGVILRGAGPPVGIFSSSETSPSKITWNGSTSQNMIKVKGPLSGWGIQQLELNASDVIGTTAIFTVSASDGRCADLRLMGVFRGIWETTFDQGSLGGSPNSMHNRWENIGIQLHDQSGGANAITLDGSGNASPSTNTSYEYFSNITIGTDGITNTLVGVYLRVCDSCQFHDVHVAFGASASAFGGLFDYSTNNNFPSSCKFWGVDPNGSHGMFTVNGAAGIGDNVIYGLIKTNGATTQVLSGVAYV